MFTAAHPCLGTVASLHVAGEAQRGHCVDAAQAVWRELDRLEAMFSTFRADSAISRINRGELHLLDAGEEVLEVLDLCTWLEQVSDGAFRARRTDGTLDPAGLVKGWATQKASHAMVEAGLHDWYLSVGGDLQTSGFNERGEPWRVGIADPFGDQQALRATIEVSGEAVATSGLYERGAHVWDGRTGVPVASGAFASVTVIGSHLTWADALATTVFAMGSDGLAWLDRFDGYDAIVIDAEGAITSTQHAAVR